MSNEVRIPGLNVPVHTLVDVLDVYALKKPEAVAFKFIDDAGTCVDSITYKDLSLRAKTIATSLIKNGLKTNDKVILIYAPGLELIATFFGCMYAGIISIPIYPPTNRYLVKKLQNIIDDTSPNLILTSTDIQKKLRALRWIKFANKIPILKNLIGIYFKKYLDLIGWDFNSVATYTTDNIATKITDNWKLPIINAENLVYLQYTSGSSGIPKGVMNQHSNLLNNINVIIKAAEVTSNDIAVSWLPPYHDMGLIGAILGSIFSGITTILMSPLSFIRKPHLWLKVISEYKATLSVAPNFAFEYCTKKINPEQLIDLDLRQFRIMMNGADIIQMSTLDNFYQTFKPCGFKLNTFFPCYGLAEASLFVSGGFYKKIIYLSSKDLQQHKKTIVSKSDPFAKAFISCGKTELDIKIVNPETKKLVDSNQIGEIWIHGSSISKGYWQREKMTEEIFHAKIADDDSNKEYLRTGDLGFIDKDEVYITGRIKDIIKLHGKNYYPQDFEDSILNCHPKIRSGGCAAISVEIENEERLAIVCEIENDTQKTDYRNIVDNICNVIANEYELPAHAVELIAAKTLFKTTSGKISHSACKYSYLNGKLISKFSWKAPIFSTDSSTEGKVEDLDLEKHQAQEPEQSDPLKRWMINWIALHTHQDITKISPKNLILKYGLDSISMVQLTQDLSEHLGVEIDPLLAWEHLSIDSLAKYIEKNQRNFPKILKFRNTEESLEKLFTFNQMYLLFHQLSHPSENIYNIGCAFELTGEINTEAFSRACQIITARHKILSMNIEMKDEKVFPVYSQNKSIKLEIITIQSNENTAAKNILSQKIHEKIMAIYDLNQDNLIRLTLFHINSKQNIFLIAAHHMIFDGTSMAIFMRELIHVYDSLIKQQSPALPSLLLQYPDYARLQHTKLNETYLNQQLNYWEKQLENATTELSFPFDQARLTNLEQQIEHYSFKIDNRTFSDIKTLSKKLKITPFVLLITAYQITLAHYCNQKDMLIGVPVHGRNNSQLKNMIGFFINILPVRFIINNDESISDLMKRNQKNLQNSYEHQDVPLPDLLNRLNIPRDIYDQPLFQTVFIMQNIEASKLTGENFNVKIYFDETGPLPYDLSLEVIPEGKSYKIKIAYNKNLIHTETAKGFAMHFQNTINLCMDNLAKHPLSFPLITSPEYDLLINQWNNTSQPYLQNTTIQKLFEKQVNLVPDKTAIVVDNQKLTYKELNIAANQLAHHLTSLGVKPNTIVAICLEKSINLIVGTIAILKAGGAFLPLDEESPENRLHEIVRDSKTKLILCSSKTQNLFSNLEINLIVLNEFKVNPKNKTAANPRPKQSSDNLAYVIYTSGTTGKPKGVLITHQGICDHLQWLANTPVDADHFVNLFSFSFDGSIAALFWPLIKGGTSIVPKSLADFALSSTIDSQPISTIFLTPSMLAILLLTHSKSSILGLNDLIIGGEPLPYRLVSEVKRITPKTKIWNFYGPTEFSVLATYYEVKQSEQGIVPIGKPIANTCCYVLDDFLNPVPMGVVGELYISGIGLAQKYLNRPELTKERFVKNPFKNSSSKLMYKTGDLVRWLPDGNLIYVARNDTQIKIRGFRIELNEIENVILSFGQIKQTAVTTHTSSTEEKILICYLILEDKKAFDMAELKNHINNCLPLYMVPQDFIIINEFPVDKNGKIDLKKLPGPPKHKREIIDINDLSFNEKKLLSIWEHVLEQKNIGIHDNFFELGGNSLTAIKLVLSAKSQSIYFTVQDLIKHPTIAELATITREELAHPHSMTAKNFIIPLNKSSAQKILFCIHPLGGTVIAYAKLAKMLEPDYLVYGIQSPGIIPTEPVFHSVSAMAKYYIEHIKKIQPQGPYTLLGWSLGGLIAYEIAQQLNATGNLVSTLYLIDTRDPATIPPIQTQQNLAVLNYILELVQANTSGIFDHLINLKTKVMLFGLRYCNPIFSRLLLYRLNSITKSKNLDLFSLLKHDLSSEEKTFLPVAKLINVLKAHGLLAENINTDEIAQYYEILRSNFYANQNYQLELYSEQIISFETENKNTVDAQFIKSQNKRIIKLPGSHLDVLRNIEALEIIHRGISNGKPR